MNLVDCEHLSSTSLRSRLYSSLIHLSSLTTPPPLHPGYVFSHQLIFPFFSLFVFTQCFGCEGKPGGEYQTAAPFSFNVLPCSPDIQMALIFVVVVPFYIYLFLLALYLSKSVQCTSYAVLFRSVLEALPFCSFKFFSIFYPRGLANYLFQAFINVYGEEKTTPYSNIKSNKC